QHRGIAPELQEAPHDPQRRQQAHGHRHRTAGTLRRKRTQETPPVRFNEEAPYPPCPPYSTATSFWRPCVPAGRSHLGLATHGSVSLSTAVVIRPGDIRSAAQADIPGGIAAGAVREIAFALL